MGLSIVCVWCAAPLLDVDHAKKHVAEKCEKAPWRASLQEASRLIFYMRPSYCARECPTDSAHEATCAEASEYLAAHPFEPPKAEEAKSA